MKIVHVPFCYYPDPVGGTEVYVENLARHLQELGLEVIVAAPGEREAKYVHDGLKVRRFPVSQHIDGLRDLYGEGDHLAAQTFGAILDDEHPDLVHLHAFTRGASVRLVREAKKRGLPVVFTYHTPTVSCQRGTLMRWGVEVCGGVLDRYTCSSCALHGLGLGKFASLALGHLRPSIGRFLASVGLQGGIWTALRMPELVELRHSTFRALMAEVEHVIALSSWVKELLLRNGVPAEKITACRHGLCQELNGEWRLANSKASGPQSTIRIAFLGRLDPTKGPDIIIQAIRLLPEAQVELHLYGLVQGAAGKAYLQRLKAMAAGDARIVFLSPIPSHQIVSLLRGYHLLAVPSRLLETGPLVVLEAFAAGIPVLGSNLGGIAELVEHEGDGLLVPPDSIEAWREAIRRVSEDPQLLMHLRGGIRPPRGMKDVAEEMVALYKTLLNRARNASAFSPASLHAHP